MVGKVVPILRGEAVDVDPSGVCQVVPVQKTRSICLSTQHDGVERATPPHDRAIGDAAARDVKPLLSELPVSGAAPDRKGMTGPSILMWHNLQSPASPAKKYRRKPKRRNLDAKLRLPFSSDRFAAQGPHGLPKRSKLPFKQRAANGSFEPDLLPFCFVTNVRT